MWTCIKTFVGLLSISRTDYIKCQVKQETKTKNGIGFMSKIWKKKKKRDGKKTAWNIWCTPTYFICIPYLILTRTLSDEYFYTHCSHQEPEVQKY